MLARFKLEKHKGQSQEEDGKTSKSKKFKQKKFSEMGLFRQTPNDSSRKDKSKLSSIRKFSKHKDIKKANINDKKKLLKEKWQSSRRTTKTSYKPPGKTGNIDKAHEETTSSSILPVDKPVKSPLVLPETTLNLSDRPIRAAAATAQVHFLKLLLNFELIEFYVTLTLTVSLTGHIGGSTGVPGH